MTSLSGFIGGSGFLVPKYQRIYTFQNNTFTWSPPQDCKAIVTVIGAGGGGAALANTGGGAAGGGAGGLAQSAEITLSSSTSYSITGGVGGLGGITSYYSHANASNGTSSSFSGTGVTTMTANGGTGGQGNSTSSAHPTAGSGGTASGGDINYTGGNGGGFASGTTYDRKATGGGAVNVTGTAYSPVNIPDYEGGASSGAGTGSSGKGIITGSNQCDIGGDPATISVIDWIDFERYTYNSNDYYYSRFPNDASEKPRDFAVPGQGGNGYASAGAGRAIAAGIGGLFAGGGGCSYASTNQITPFGGNGGNFGGGGGGAVGRTGRGVSGGRGGDGVVFVAVTEWL